MYYDKKKLSKKFLNSVGFLLEGEIVMLEKFMDFIVKIELDTVLTKNAGEILKSLF